MKKKVKLKGVVKFICRSCKYPCQHIVDFVCDIGKADWKGERVVKPVRRRKKP